jgi:nicotinamidase/pyrazinamidase
MMKRALLLVDIQNDFLPGGPLGVPGGNDILDFVVTLLHSREHYELVVATQDWHPKGHGSFASSYPGTVPFDTGKLGGIEQVFWPDHCVQGSEGAMLAPPIKQALAEITAAGRKTVIIKKGQDPAVDSYSAFYDNARIHDTGLLQTLQSYDCSAVDVVGLAFDFCVKATALDAVSFGLATRILMAGTRAINPDAVETVKRELAARGIDCVEDFDL